MAGKKRKTIYITNSAAETKRLGELLARSIIKTGCGDRARVLSLRGGLGAGKTQFVQGFARGLGVKDTVNSPTFVILKKYLLSGIGGFKTFYHIDCYRLRSGRDLAGLGIAKILGAEENIVALEWPMVVEGDLSLGARIEIDLEAVEKDKRRIIISES